MNPTWALSLLSFVTGILMALSPRCLAAVSPLVGDQSTSMCCTYLAIPIQFESIQNQPDKVRRSLNDPATV
jgi:hypothetical protein